MAYVTTAATLVELKKIASAIDELSAHSATENVFYESWMLLPAFEFLPQGKVEVVLVWREDRSTLIGVFPLEIRREFHWLPIQHYTLWQHLHCFLCTPLVRAGDEEECLNELFMWLKSQRAGRFLFVFNQLSVDGVFYQHLQHFIEHNQFVAERSATFSRPFLQSKLDPTVYLNAALSSKHVKTLKKKLAKLKELGTVRVEAFSGSALEVAEWATAFLKLEQSGWKGRAQTAMAFRDNETRFFKRVLEGALQEGKLMFFKLSLNDEPIAMRCGFKTGSGAFSFKIAFNEAYGKFSPGTLLEVEHLHLIQSQSKISWVDSCALPNQVMLRRLWSEEREITSITVSGHSSVGKLLITSLSRLKKVRDALQVLTNHKWFHRKLPEGDSFSA